jgi:hypothetical protein
MKSQSYHYDNGKTGDDFVKLDFSFPEGEKQEQQKKDFRELLKEATRDLENEK